MTLSPLGGSEPFQYQQKLGHDNGYYNACISTIIDYMIDHPNDRGQVLRMIDSVLQDLKNNVPQSTNITNAIQLLNVVVSNINNMYPPSQIVSDLEIIKQEFPINS